MNPRVGIGIFILCLIGTLIFWLTQDEPQPEKRPRVVAPKRVLPKVAPRVYEFPRPEKAPVPVAPTPKEEQVPLSRDTHAELVTATNQAMGAGWQGCVRPWVDENVDEDVPAEPLVVFFDMVDGRLSDIRLRSPIELPEHLTECFAEAVWDGEFPEDAAHRGQVSVQRVITIKK